MTLPEHYDPDTVEQHVKDHWADVDAYQQSNAATADEAAFYFVDGPPNTSGQMHCGTAWGKVLKDAFLRYYRMQGHDVRARPGYDTHGLPVERRVESELGVESKQDVESYGVEAFVHDCRDFVETQRERMDEEFADLGVWMDWDDPYQTMDTEYMEVVWQTFAELYESDLLERERRVVNTCPDCETSVAETRLSYEQRDTTAAYVGFELTDHDGYLVTWTTTPWTVTANQFVAVDREATYVAVETAERVLYVAQECVDDLMNTLGVTEYEQKTEYTGEELVGWTYENPLAESLPEDSPATEGVVAHAEYVELDRTGLVHSAPGFGAEDFERGRELDFPAYAPLDDSGVFTHERTDGVPDKRTSSTGQSVDSETVYEGKTVDELREVVLSNLDAAGALVDTHAHDHEYPQCPRCDTQVVYRAASQWVVQVSAFKDDLLDAVGETAWYPADARDNRFQTMVEQAPDWNVSRQRYWGTPVPVWSCVDCGHDVVVRDRTDLAERADLDSVPEDLHRPSVDDVTVDCPACGGTASRETDVLDVWFDSAVASWATERTSPPETPDHWPANLLVEGHDQTRGWFLMQLYLGVVFADRAPYDEVLMHGFATLDGRAMSKSTGHVLRPETVVEEHGRDAFRAHLLGHNPTKDVNLDSELSGVETVADELDVVWNVYRFALLYMDMDERVPERTLATTTDERTVLDNWVLSRLQTTVETVQEAMENRRTDRAFEAVRSFLVEDVSRYYVRGVRDRVWEGSPAAYDTLGTVLHEGTRLLAPFTPFLADRLYDELDGAEVTVHATAFPEPAQSLRDSKLEDRFTRVRALEEATATARQRAGRKRRWPVVEVVVETDDDLLAETVTEDSELLEKRLNTEYVVPTREYDRVTETVRPEMDKLGPAFGEDASAVARRLRDGVATAFPADVEVGRETVTVTREMVSVDEETPEDVEAVEFEYGTVYVDTSLPTTLKREGVYRDLLRHAQRLRDELGVEMDERVVLSVDAQDTMVSEVVESYREELQTEARAKKVVTESGDADATTTVSVDEADVFVGVRRAN